jgi:hypothetical protein
VVLSSPNILDTSEDYSSLTGGLESVLAIANTGVFMGGFAGALAR